MLWVVFAFIGSFFSAASSETNRIFKVNGHALNYWRMVASILLLLPFVIMADWPANPWIYVSAATCGLLVALADPYLFQIAAKYSGRTALLTMPITMATSFILWLGIDGEYRAELLNSPYKAAGILACLGLVIFAFIRANKCRISSEALPAIFLAGGLFGTQITFMKWALEQATFTLGTAAVFIFSGYVLAVALITSLGLIFRKKGPWRRACRFSPVILLPAFAVASTRSLNVFAETVAQAHSPNPAYVTAIIMMSIVWIALYHYLRKIEDRFSPVAACCLVIAGVGITMLK